MCEICLQNPCHSRCPNSKEKIACRCVACKEAIFEGEEYADVYGEAYHIECLENLDINEMKELFDFKLRKIGDD